MEGIWETGLTVYYLYPKRFDSLTTCGCNCNGSKFPWANQVVCSFWGTSVEERVALTGSGKGAPDPAFPPLFRENPASRSFFINFPHLAFLSQKNTLKSIISTKANKC